MILSDLAKYSMTYEVLRSLSVTAQFRVITSETQVKMSRIVYSRYIDNTIMLIKQFLLTSLLTGIVSFCVSFAHNAKFNDDVAASEIHHMF